MSEAKRNVLGDYLKDRRARLDPAHFGFEAGRRRTPGLRREEVALLANVSATWYTWLEQGRGGPPSSDVLERLARALALTRLERDHLFLLAQKRLPQVRAVETCGISPRLQRVLDALNPNPAMVKTATWDIIGWNHSATVVLSDYNKMSAHERNLLRMLFTDPGKKNTLPNWHQIARFSVAILRADTARNAIDPQPLVDELSAISDEFTQLWNQHHVSSLGEGSKEIWHAQSGLLTLEYMTFAVDQQPDLGLVVYQPVTDTDRHKINQLLDAAQTASLSSSV